MTFSPSLPNLVIRVFLLFATKHGDKHGLTYIRSPFSTRSPVPSFPPTTAVDLAHLLSPTVYNAQLKHNSPSSRPFCCPVSRCRRPDWCKSSLSSSIDLAAVAESLSSAVCSCFRQRCMYPATSRLFTPLIIVKAR